MVEQALLAHHYDLVKWLLQVGVIGADKWGMVWQRWGELCDTSPDSAVLLKSLFARVEPPLSVSIRYGVLSSFRSLSAVGGIVRARLPVGSRWRVRWSAALAASDCGRNMGTTVVGVVEGYADVREEELWAMLERSCHYWATR
jgi:hypothetical protein